MMMRAFICLFFLWVFPIALQAQVVYDAHTEAELISEVSAVKPGEPFWVGLRLKTDPHWHTYWRNPGDSGLATTIRWTLPEGFTASEIFWPYPERIDVGSLTSYAYEDEVVLLTRITPSVSFSQSSVEIKARADWLACEVPCIPGRGDFAITLPVSGQTENNVQWSEVFADAYRRLPAKDPSWTFDVIDQGASYVFYASTNIPDPRIAGAAFFPYRDDVLVHSASQNFDKMDEGNVQLTLKKNVQGSSVAPKILDGVFVLYDFNGQVIKAVDVTANLGQKASMPGTGSVPAASSAGLWMMLVFAFLGGMILNLMPCVFPVLSIKVLSFVKHAQDRRSLVLSAAGYTAGVTAAFVILAVLLIVLRKGGEAVGWGFQFQSPGFVVVMMFLLLLVALNLLGLFEVKVPGFEVSGVKRGSHVLEAFLGGILAVIVATPCTAPFMGAAMGFALTQGAVVNVLIFVSLGLGMAAPFVLLCVFPSVLRGLPRPGPWMQNFKVFLAFPLLATIIWLLWVLEGQKGFDAVVAMMGSLLLISLGIWLLSVAQRPALRGVLAGLVGCLLIFVFVKISSWPDPAAATKSSDNIWLDYDVDQVRTMEQEGKTIFYDFTARWCLTCQVNKKTVLDQPDVMAAFQDKGVVLIRADWTNRDAGITQQLKKFGKNSVPVYVLSYPLKHGRDIRILPEVLTKNIVLEALDGIGTQP